MSYSMRDLFQQETRTHVDRLKHYFTELQQHPDRKDDIDAALQSIRAIVGAAHLIEFDAAIHLSEVMQSCLSAAYEGRRSLTANKLDALLHGCTLLSQMSQLEGTKGWLSNHAEDLEKTQSLISEAQTSQPLAPTSEKGQGSDSPGVIPNQSVNAIDPRPLNPPRAGDFEREISSEGTAPDLKVPQNGGFRGLPGSVAPTDQFGMRETPVNKADRSESIPEPSIEESASSSAQNIAQNDPELMELFRQEVEAQTITLNRGLVAIEAHPNSRQELESLMRAAHSIKGAARIVGLDIAVELAHQMEDCFVAAQKQSLTLNAAKIDALFRSVDLTQSISQAQNIQHWLSQHRSELESVQQLLSLDTAPTSPPITPPPTPKTPEPQETDTNSQRVSSSTQERDRVVRISADNLNRIVGLAGESMVEAYWLQPFAESLMELRSQQIVLSKALEDLQQDHPIAQLDHLRQQERECRDLLSDRIAELGEYIRRTDNLSDRLYREVIQSQMRPFADGVQGFPRMVRDLARQLGKQVQFSIVGENTPVDRDILTKLEAPITHILRNAIDHGLELPEERIKAGKSPEGTIQLEASHRGGMLMITISDDGKGIDPDQVRKQVIRRHHAPPEVARRMSHTELMEFLFLPGFSLSKQVTELSGRGVGLDIVKAMAQEVGGTVRAVSSPNAGTSFHLQLPLTLSVVRTLLVEVSGEQYAFPLSRIDRILNLDRNSISVVENQSYFTFNNQHIGLISLAQVFDLPQSNTVSESLCVIVLSYQSAQYGLIVDRALGERELVVRPLDPRLGKIQDISAASLMSDGSLVLIVDVSDLVRSMNSLLDAGKLSAPRPVANQPPKKRILVVDDSITVREVERKLLEKQGYAVDVAIDGMEGWNAVRNQAYDLVISDIDMPRMNGIELIQEIKTHPRLRSTPVIVVSYRDRESDRLQGLDAGADYYLTKNSFQDDSLIQAVVDLIGQ
ncbi:hybrid sensor histidine kinase/response regulator [Leptolyngbya sp. NIES-2104]|uniref:hybrid sensor histidine kinase/response regulator n=1 Tax=Leptolyngbya sp. NIES-2104 TaxID=1552121 RepID=UPI0006ECB9EA|nr:hybrid sensor histidine kinase/response regulator [Leptolyngbya sp. NIES-2104]GAP99255.1 signal transduction histidine kinase CheA [Leptolyngbya sp. NIES-2104]